MKRIVLVGSYPLTEKCICGGVESSLFGLAQELSKKHEVNVFDLPRIRGCDTVEKGVIFVNRYANQGRYNENMLSRQQDYLRDIVALHPHIVHIHGTGEFCRVLYLGIVNYGIPCIVTVHGLLAVEKRKALFRSLKHLSKLPKACYQYCKQRKTEYAFLEKLDNAIVDTKYVMDTLKTYPVSKLPQMNIIPQGIDERFYNLKCDADSNTILSVGTISPRKGHLLLLNAFNIACEKGMNAKLHIVGAVSDTKYYLKLKAQINKSPYASEIKLTVNATQKELDFAYQTASVFALHTQEESQGIVFAEAMATGMPIVSTKVGGVPFVVSDKENGYLSSFGDLDAFAHNLKELIENKEMWKKYSQSAVQRAKDYDWGKITEKILLLYDGLEMKSVQMTNMKFH